MGYFVLFLILNRWRRLTLAACNQLAQSVLKIGFALAKKGTIWGGGRVSAWSGVHMAAALIGCTKALVGTGWTISHLVSTTGSGSTPLPL